MNPEKRTMLPPGLFHSFAKRFEEPSVKEGFQDIVKVEFVVSDRMKTDTNINVFCMLTLKQFQGTEAQKAIWTKYWL
jgi:bifunctional polynucleotide phosphatase/kinase